jgi:putative transposase
MIKTIRVMLLPNNKQKTKLFQYANTARFAYNWALGREQENYKNGGKFISDGDLRKEFTQLKKAEGIKDKICEQQVTNKPLKTLVILTRGF